MDAEQNHRCDRDVASAWAIEIAKRIQELNAGTAKTIPWAEARRQLLGKRSKRRHDRGKSG